MLTNTKLGSNLSIIINNIILFGKQYWILYGLKHHFKNLGLCVLIALGNHKTKFPKWYFGSMYQF